MKRLYIAVALIVFSASMAVGFGFGGGGGTSVNNRDITPKSISMPQVQAQYSSINKQTLRPVIGNNNQVDISADPNLTASLKVRYKADGIHINDNATPLGNGTAATNWAGVTDAAAQATLGDLGNIHGLTSNAQTQFNTTNTTLASLQSQLNSLAGGVSLLTTDPAVPADGQIWINTTSSKMKYRSGLSIIASAAFSLESTLTAVLAWSPAPWIYPDTTQGVTSSAKQFTLTNSGPVTASGLSVTTGNAVYAVSASTCGSTLASSASCTADVTFTPSSVTAFNYNLIASATGLSDTTAGLTGNGISSLNVFKNFEATLGSDTTQTVTQILGTSGTGAVNDTTAPVGKGSQQVKIYSGGSVATAEKLLIGSTTAIEDVHFMFKFDVLPTTDAYIFHYTDASFAQIGHIQLLTNGKLRTYHGGSLLTTTDALSTNTWYHVWGYQEKGTGANGIYSVAFSTTTTRPTSGTAYARGTNGTNTSDIGGLIMATAYGTTAFFDQLIGSTSDVGTIP